ncbi:hypothetical protein Focb16_v003504 [Fusarium oxysporum f. sp. cubense]|uniref:2EXR domain-containing protein n=1 Tax=Fusarium oxysporum f. sp. cubense TaxID=61366 RepID=A0A559KMC3_FUSOC|nr:hypothetical protein Focb16_v003504 [Fusarium oxysporum f. sp. cubense]
MGQSMSNDFESFNKLPPELCLMIWEEALPKKKDTHAAYKIFRSAFLHGLRLEKAGGADGPLPLLEACYDARAVAMKSGSYMTVKNKKYRLHNSARTDRCTDVWTHHQFTKQHPGYCFHGAYTQGLEALQKCLTQDPEYKGIKTVYLGIVGIPIHYSKGDDPDYYPCTESDSAVVPLDDKKLITYLASAYKSHASMAIGDPVLREEGFYRKSALRFKNSLEKDWKHYHSLRSKWDLENGIRLLPAVIFGEKTRKAVLWSSGLLESLALKIKISHREAQADLAWMDAFAYENGAGNENNLNELPFQRERRRVAHREKNTVRELYYSPHDFEGERRWNVPP